MYHENILWLLTISNAIFNGYGEFHCVEEPEFI